jgi:hypothetical protein
LRSGTRSGHEDIQIKQRVDAHSEQHKEEGLRTRGGYWDQSPQSRWPNTECVLKSRQKPANNFAFKIR